MSRFPVLFLFSFLGLVSWLLSAAPPAVSRAPAPMRANTLRLPKVRPGEELDATLRKVVDFPAQDDPKITLGDMLDYLGKKYNVDFDVNEKAFKRESLNEPLKAEVANPALPSIRASLGTVLKKILARVNNESGATYLIRNDVIEITTVATLRDEVWGKDFIGPHLPLICLTADKKPLDEVVAFLAEQGERNVAIDPRVGEKAQAPITTYMINKPLDSALFLVADMAGLAYVQIDNTFYITTTDRAEALKADWKARRPVVPAPKKSDAPAKLVDKAE